LIFHRVCREDDDFRVFLCIVSFLAAHHFSNAKVIAAEPTGADDSYRSLRDGVIHLSEHPNTICDGLRTNLGDINFPIIKALLQEILLVDDQDTIHAMRLLFERMKIVVEPSGAIVLGAVMMHKEQFAGKKVGLILSGGNVDVRKLGSGGEGGFYIIKLFRNVPLICA
jgi:threonine dehydratase